MSFQGECVSKSKAGGLKGKQVFNLSGGDDATAAAARKINSCKQILTETFQNEPLDFQFLSCKAHLAWRNAK